MQYIPCNNASLCPMFSKKVRKLWQFLSVTHDLGPFLPSPKGCLLLDGTASCEFLGDCKWENELVKLNLFLITKDLFSHFFQNASVFVVFRQEPPSNLIYPREYTPSDSTQPYLTLIQQRISEGCRFISSQIGLNISPIGSSSLSLPRWTNLDRAKM